VAIGAMLFSSYFCKFFDVPIDYTSTLILGLSVWAIYTFDHLIDSKKSKTTIHLFHKRNYKTFSVVLVIVLIAIGILLPLLPANTLKWGAVLSLGVVIYFLTINMLPLKSIYHKELMIAIVYFIGVLLIPITHEAFVFKSTYLPVLICYFIVVINNIIIFSMIDMKHDLSSGFPSLSQNLRISNINYILITLNVLLVLVMFSSLQFWDVLSIGVCTTMATILFLIYYFKDRPVMRKYYRVIGDGIFYLPALYLL